MIPAPIRLPDPRQRLTPARKELILTALRRGEIQRAQVLARYRLTEEELDGWQRRFAQHGQPGLSVSKLQELRS